MNFKYFLKIFIILVVLTVLVEESMAAKSRKGRKGRKGNKGRVGKKGGRKGGKNRGKGKGATGSSIPNGEKLNDILKAIDPVGTIIPCGAAANKKGIADTSQFNPFEFLSPGFDGVADYAKSATCKASFDIPANTPVIMYFQTEDIAQAKGTKTISDTCDDTLTLTIGTAPALDFCGNGYNKEQFEIPAVAAAFVLTVEFKANANDKSGRGVRVWLFSKILLEPPVTTAKPTTAAPTTPSTTVPTTVPTTKPTTPAPTAAPTPAPTPAPTAAPTPAPTAAPTTPSITAAPPQSCFCGQSFAASFAERAKKGGGNKNTGEIVGGTPSVKNGHPWTVALYSRSSPYLYRGAGFIVSKNYVLSSSRILQTGVLTSDLFVVTGEHNPYTIEGTEQVYAIQRIINAPSASPYKDLILIQVATPIVFGPTAVPACLPDSNFAYPNPGDVVTVVGWGATSPGSTQGVTSLLQVALNSYSPAFCSGIYTNLGYVYEPLGNICAGGVNRGVCDRDIGGPLTSTGPDGKKYAIGVAQFTHECGVTPSVFTKVSVAYSWITSFTGQCQASVF